MRRELTLIEVSLPEGSGRPTFNAQYTAVSRSLEEDPAVARVGGWAGGWGMGVGGGRRGT
jgi:hypothetical protein